MIKTSLWLCAAFLLAMTIGPVTFAMAQSGRPDGADIYLVLEPRASAGLTRDLARVGAREIGPLRAPFARLITAVPTGHADLQNSGYLIMPASALALLCGIKIKESVS